MSQAQLLPTVSSSASPFQFKGFSIRTQVEGDHLWFVAKDVCAALDIDWSGKTLSVIPESWQSMGKVPTLCRGMQRVKRISEPAVYKLAFRSNKPEADDFTNWVASEVLPAIRKTGQYAPAPKKAVGRAAKALPAANQEVATSPIQARIIEKSPKDMGAGRKQALKRIEDILKQFYGLRDTMRLCVHPGGYSCGRSVSEKDRYDILMSLYHAADANLAAAYNALEAGYRMGREIGRG